MAKYHARLRVVFSSEKAAMDAYKALSPDNDDYVNVSIEGDTLLCIARGKNTPSLLGSVDDFLTSLGLYIKTLGSVEKRA